MEKILELLTPNEKRVKVLCDHLGCGRIMASLLVNRHICQPEDARSFLDATLQDIRPPFSIKDMDVGVTRICEAVTRKQRILIFGDYDVDGTAATALLYDFFCGIGADVSYYIPHRIEEGYGLKPFHIPDCMVAGRVQLVITVDCGIASHAAVDAANAAGIDVVITDHHIPPTVLPRAHAVINPRRRDCTAGFRFLAGVGVAFCLVICLRKALRERGFFGKRSEPNLKAACDLVALGTVADMVPLVKENRILSKTGLGVINQGGRRGIASLVSISGIEKGCVDAEDIAFRLGPRLNAAGRIGHADAAVVLLTTVSPEDSQQISQTLHARNRDRQALEKEILVHVDQLLAEAPRLVTLKSILLAHEDWHLGVLGIVASRIARKYYRPTILLTQKNGIGKGSVRSIPGLDIHTVLSASSAYLVDFGGHAMAAGLTLEMDKMSQFHEALEQVIAKMTTPAVFKPRMSIDHLLDFDDISPQLIDDIERLEPFGVGNPQPLFMTRNVSVVSSKIVGRHHRRMVLAQHHSKIKKTVDAIQFNVEANASPPAHFEELVFQISWNRWKGRKSPRIVVRAV